MEKREVKISFTSDDKYFITIEGSNVQVFEIQTRLVIYKKTFETEISYFAFEPHTQFSAFTTKENPNDVLIHDRMANEIIKTISHENEIKGLKFGT